MSIRIPGWWRRGLALVGAALVIGAVLVFSDGAAEDGSATPAVSGTAEPAVGAAARSVNVVVDTVWPEPFTDVIRVTGTAAAMRDVTVAAEESGVIRALYTEKGSRVAAGQPIAKIDDRVIRAQHEEARASAALARETYERQKRLWEQERIGSEMAYLQARYRAETADAAVEVLAARLERTIVRAPIAGILDDRMVEVGSMVAPGAPVARVIAVDRIKVAAGVPERFVASVDRGDAARIIFDVLDGRAFEGEVEFVGSALNLQNRTIPVEVVVPNPGGLIKPGMVATVALARARQDSALVVPQQAVLRTEDGYTLFVAARQGERAVAERRQVELGALDGDRVEVLAGLQPGEAVIIVGQNQVTSGDLLNVVEQR